MRSCGCTSNFSPRFTANNAESNLVQTVSQPSALLDLRFNDGKDAEQDILAAVSSTGSLAIFKLDPAKDRASPLQHLVTTRCDDLGEDVLFLQCNWHPTLRNILAVTTSTGQARLLVLDDQRRISQYVDLDINNTLEAWSIAFSPTPSTLNENCTNVSVYCGGDDSMLRYTSCSWPVDGAMAEPEVPFGSMMLKGKHDAGVTAILPLQLKTKEGGRVVVTGSYDDHLRVFVIFDLDITHGLRRVEEVVHENLGGGVWRLNLVSLDESENDGSARIVLLASCMHAGARVVELRVEAEGAWTCRVLTRFEEHKSMNYASDYFPLDSGKLLIASSSFYDKLLCLWESDTRT